MLKKAARSYDQQLRTEINGDRVKNGKKPLKDKDDDDNNDDGSNANTKEITVSTTDPDSGLFHKGEHKVVFAYSAHVACDKNNFYSRS